MKNFLKYLWGQTGTKLMVFAALPVAILFTVWISIHDGEFYYIVLLAWVIFMFLIALFTVLFDQNSPTR